MSKTCKACNACNACPASLACIAGVARFVPIVKQRANLVCTVFVGDYPFQCNILTQLTKEDVDKCPGFAFASTQHRERTKDERCT